MSKRIKKSLGELLLESSVITQEQLRSAQLEADRSELSLGSALVKLYILSEKDMVDFISRRMEIPRIELANYLIDDDIINLIPEPLARKHLVIPVLKIGGNLTCAMADVFNVFALDSLSSHTGLTIEPAIATEEEITKAIDGYYSTTGTFDDVIDHLHEKADSSDEDLAQEDAMEEAPVIKLVNMIIGQAVSQGASDVHIEPQEHESSLRYRIDGILHEQKSPPKHYHLAIVSRIKVMANLNISERRRAQDGRFPIKMSQRSIDVRVSCLPSIYGENIVLRLLDTSNILMGLDQIGFSPDVLTRYQELVKKPNGIILVTGPTGSGKTTTLYASLNAMRSAEKSVITIEDPVEYRLGGIQQIQVDPQVELTFANGLRSILRQDPDIIMVGEIRDYETAEMAIQASLTGHLVLATLHTNNASGAISRMIDIGVEPFLLSSSVIGVLAQRLVRRICEECQGKGCSTCLQTGYKGRTGIYELMTMDESIRDLVMQKSPAEKLHRQAVTQGMVSLRDDGLLKVEEGLTTKQEVLRVTQDE